MQCATDGDVLHVDHKNNVVPGAPPSAFYFRNFISEDEEEMLLQHVYSSPKPKWVRLSNRRLQNWGGLPHPKGMVSEAIPDWLNKYLRKLGSMDFFDGNVPNHVLVNEYLPGQGIMPHKDGPLFYPTITTINLGSHAVLDFYKQIDDEHTHGEEKIESSACSSRYVGSFFLERRSLVCFKEDMYDVYLHGIEELKEDTFLEKNIFNIDCCELNTSDVKERDTRVSLTIRYFPKVLKFKLGRK